MLIIHADIFAKEGLGDEIAKIAQPLITATQAEEGCISYNLFRDTTDNCLFRFVEYWESQEALDRHVKSEHFQKYFPQLTERTSKPAVIKSHKVAE